MHLQWTLKPFADLTPHELYALLRLRNEVFVVEQQCVFQDADNLDQACHHLYANTGAEPVAYSRLVPPGVAYTEASIGRVVTSPSVRRQGAGRVLLPKAIEAVYTLFGVGPIRIGAQRYLEDFYGSFGFVPDGDSYLEDGIPHIEMVKAAGRSTK